MQIKNSVALVTGANRGIGKCLVEALLASGAAKVYATSRSGTVPFADPRVVPLKLDVTKPTEILAAARTAGDVSILVNNAGICEFRSGFKPVDLSAARREMEVNYWGLLRMTQAFQPILKANGGGAMVSLLSIASHLTFPVATSYCVSKAAAHSLTQGLRAELAGQGTLVVGAYLGPVDTDMVVQLPGDKEKPDAIARDIVACVEAGTDEYVAAMARDGIEAAWSDPQAIQRDIAVNMPAMD